MPVIVKVPLALAEAFTEVTRVVVFSWNSFTESGPAHRASPAFPLPWNTTDPFRLEVPPGQFKRMSRSVTGGGIDRTALSLKAWPGLFGAVQPVFSARTL